MKLLALTALGGIFFYSYLRWRNAMLRMKGPNVDPIPDDESVEQLLKRFQHTPVHTDDVFWKSQFERRFLNHGDIVLPDRPDIEEDE